MAKVPIHPKVGMRTYQQPNYNSRDEERYEDLHEGYIHPSQITKNGTSLFNFINEMAREISSTEENERAAAGVMFRGDDRRLGYSIRHSKIHELERVGRDMEAIMNEGHRQRELQKTQSQVIQVNLNDLLNADKAFDNLTQGSKRPVIQNNYTKEETKTMSDIDISEYLGGTPQRSAVQQNNTFYVNMDKTSKAILAEQVKTNKLLGILVQSIRENGIKIEELPQHIAELVAANNLPDAEIMNDAEYDAATSTDTSIDDLLP